MKQTTLTIGITTAVFCLSFFSSYHYISHNHSESKSPMVKQSHSSFPHYPEIADKDTSPQTEGASGDIAYPGASPSEGGSYIQSLDEYVADTLARTPRKERARRTVQLAGMLYPQEKERARDLLESSVIGSAKRGEPLYPAALNFLWNIYSEETSLDGYRRLLAGVPKSYPGRAAVVHDAARAYVNRDEINRAYSLLLSELENNKDDQTLFCDLATVYEKLPAAEITVREKEDTAAVQSGARLFYSLGNHFLVKGEDELARSAFENAATLDPSYADQIALDPPQPSEDTQCTGA